MPQCCAVPLCSARQSGHRFPKNMNLRKKWLVAIQRPDFIPSEHARVCNRHFTLDDFTMPNESFRLKPKPTLKKNVVPSVFPWNTKYAQISGNTLLYRNFPTDNTERLTKNNEGSSNFRFAAQKLAKMANENQNNPSSSEQQTFPNVEIKDEPVEAEEETTIGFSQQQSSEEIVEGVSIEKNESIEVIVKEEFDENQPSVIKEEPLEVEIKPETFNCLRCSVVTDGETFCDNCNQMSTCSKSYPSILKILNESSLCLKYSGLSTPQSFMELLNYIGDDLPPIEGCFKSNQLLSVLVKLHFNKELGYMNKYRFPLVYVKTVNVLSEKLQFLGDTAWETSYAPLCFQKLFRANHKKIAIFHLVNIKVDFSDTNKVDECKILVAYTISGRVFFVSSHFNATTSFKTIVKKSSIFDVIDSKEIYVVYKIDDNFVKCTPETFEKQCEKLPSDAQNHFSKITNRIEDEFLILNSVFPAYTVLETDGTTFLQKIVSACGGLLNYKLALTK